VISGAEDRITPATVVRQVAKKYKAVSTYKEFENHAHWVVAEPGRQDISEYVAGWIEQALAKSA
jgi:alpha-beta hydrolase superfamily lysophospholipase